MLDTSKDQPVHYPENPMKFEFDKDVAPIFPNMAQRSIPNYAWSHRLHADMLMTWFIRDGSTVLDVGASRGEFFRALDRSGSELGLKPKYERHAIDSSEAMCALLRADFPDVNVRCGRIDSTEFLTSPVQYDVVNAMYVLQFLKPDIQRQLLRQLVRMVKTDGALIIGKKDASIGMVGDMLQDQYIQFRLRNGYSLEEIHAKNKALSNSMWLMSHEEMVDIIKSCGVREVRETTRGMNFSTIFCYK